MFVAAAAVAVLVLGTGCSSSGTVGGSAKGDSGSSGGSAGSSGGASSSSGGAAKVHVGKAAGEWKGTGSGGEAVDLVISSSGKAELKSPHHCTGDLRGDLVYMTCDDGNEDWRMADFSPVDDGSKSATLSFEGQQDKVTVNRQ
ncbi:MAG: hypothetical protein HOV83_28090 [Catenulispora sp.]|nr:hypothetical protein [Catenulispora sp.]